METATRLADFSASRGELFRLGFLTLMSSTVRRPLKLITILSAMMRTNTPRGAYTRNPTLLTSKTVANGLDVSGKAVGLETI
jgi:hypothetical protein